MIEQFTQSPRVAYFSMEIAFDISVPTYAGGLGVLAGDTLRSACELNIPMVGITLVSHAGYFRQEIDADGRQREYPDFWNPAFHAQRLEAKIVVHIENRPVWIGGWLYILRSTVDVLLPIILLDTDIPENAHEDRELTHYLYGGDEAYRLKQEAVLGIGGMRMLQALGYQIFQYHMNEGHSAFLAIELLRRKSLPASQLRAGESPYDIRLVREQCCFTTHTPVHAGHDRFSYELVARVLGDYIDIQLLKKLAGDDTLNMTQLALNLSDYVNGVAKRHAEISSAMFPGYTIHAITNGCHPQMWTSTSFQELYNERLPGWCHEPELLAKADHYLSDDGIWQAHIKNKEKLLREVEIRNGIHLDLQMFTLGFARRMTAYKRPDLLFMELDRLRQINEHYPIQIILAGKAHPRDSEGKELIARIQQYRQLLQDSVTVVYLPNYNMELARALVAGVDVWLNTPRPPQEASGTSGMKAVLNGVPNFSVLDGWWIEGCIEGITGWSIPDGEIVADVDVARLLYDKLEHIILPLFYKNRSGWIQVMKNAISKNASYFNSHRMMRRYAAEAYLK